MLENVATAAIILHSGKRSDLRGQVSGSKHLVHGCVFDCNRSCHALMLFGPSLEKLFVISLIFSPPAPSDSPEVYSRGHTGASRERVAQGDPLVE